MNKTIIITNVMRNLYSYSSVLKYSLSREEQKSSCRNIIPSIDYVHCETDFCRCKVEDKYYLVHKSHLKFIILIYFLFQIVSIDTKKLN